MSAPGLAHGEFVYAMDQVMMRIGDEYRLRGVSFYDTKPYLRNRNAFGHLWLVSRAHSVAKKLGYRS